LKSVLRGPVETAAKSRPSKTAEFINIAEYPTMPPRYLNEKLAIAGSVVTAAWVAGLFFAFQPMHLTGFPTGLTAGAFEWVFLILAIVSSAACFRLLYLAIRYRGVAWWGYAIGTLPATTTVLIGLAVVAL